MKPAAAVLVALVITGCGGDDAKPAAKPTPSSTPPTVLTGSDVDVFVPEGQSCEEAIAKLPAKMRENAHCSSPRQKGNPVVVTAGCLACHRIGETGNDGPGGDLTHVGAELSRAQLRRALVKPDPPMPSFAGLTPRRMRALIDYLTSLR